MKQDCAFGKLILLRHQTLFFHVHMSVCVCIHACEWVFLCPYNSRSPFHVFALDHAKEVLMSVSILSQCWVAKYPERSSGKTAAITYAK